MVLKTWAEVCAGCGEDGGEVVEDAGGLLADAAATMVPVAGSRATWPEV